MVHALFVLLVISAQRKTALRLLATHQLNIKHYNSKQAAFLVPLDLNAQQQPDYQLLVLLELSLSLVSERVQLAKKVKSVQTQLFLKWPALR